MQIPHGQKALSIQEIRELDRLAAEEYGMPGLLLMEHAGTGIYEYLRDVCRAKTTLIVCGKGNNGGDGMVIARHLYNAGEKVALVFASDPQSISGDAAVQLEMIFRLKIPFCIFSEASAAEIETYFQRAEVLIDAMLGSGLSAAVRGPYSGLIEMFNRAQGFKASVDLPSGIHGDTGEVMGAAVRTDLTCTLGAWKKCFLRPGIEEWTGSVRLIDIGLPRPLRERTESVR